MTRKVKVEVAIDKNVLVSISGSYFGGYMGSREDPPEEPSFEIESVKLISGSLTELLDAIDDNLKQGQTINEFLSDKACESMLSEAE